MALGAKFRARSYGAVAAAATPGSGTGPEVIWHQFYDTQTSVSAGQATLRFFQVTSSDVTISNLPAGGQLPDPQFLAIHDICLDYLVSGTSGASGYVSLTATLASNLGSLNDMGTNMFVGRPIWTMYISDKRYGPYSLTTLHGTGAIIGVLAAWGTATATVSNVLQMGYNTPMAGWNYEGSVIIPPKTNFQIQVDWPAAQATTSILLLRMSMFGVLTRRVV